MSAGTDDVEMSVPQPVYEVVRAPRLREWSQEALVSYKRERKQYEERIHERCNITGEVVGSVMASVKSSFERSVLEHVCEYVLDRNIFEVTDEDLVNLIKSKVANVLNEHIPDIMQLFSTLLKMNMRVKDICARIAMYYMDFDRLVEEYGLLSLMGRGPVHDEEGRRRMKLRCKVLIALVQPEVLRVELERLADTTHYMVKSDCKALYRLMIERAMRQQQQHMMLSELKPSTLKKTKPVTGCDVKAQHERPRVMTTNASSVARPATAGPRPPPKGGCLFCKGPHWLSDCPKASEQQKTEAKDKATAAKAGRVKCIVAPVESTTRGTAFLGGLLEVPFCADTGSDINVVSQSVVEELLILGAPCAPRVLSPLVEVLAAGGNTFSCDQAVTLDVEIRTAAGPLVLPGVECIVLPGKEEEFLLGRATLRDIGIDVERLFEQLVEQTLDAADAEADDIPSDHVELASAPGGDEIELEIERMVNDAVREGFDPLFVGRLRALMLDYPDVWRARLEGDEPARVDPMQVELLPDTRPFRAAVRRYPDRQREFLREYIRELERHGYVYRNNNSRWASPALPVRKPGTDDYRMTVDYRRVNSALVPLAGASPHLDSELNHVRGSYGFGTFDFFKGFWQLPLAQGSQELFSIVTEDGVFTPTRVPQGACDSALHFQGQMHSVFQDLLHIAVLIWIDDLILFAADAASYLQRLHQFLETLRVHNLKLNARKCTVFSREVVWCGRVISGQGIAHDPSRLAALRELQLPPTAADLQHFVCAMNWLHDSIVDFARLVEPLRGKLEAVMTVRGRRKAQLRGALLTWSDDEILAFQTVLTATERVQQRHFADPDAIVCVFTDASKTGWAMVVTQVRAWATNVAVQDQQHELLICKGGMFRKAQANWSVIEKEAYPIVKACSELEYLLDRDGGFRIYCDHANLIQVFAPGTEVKQHIKGKLQRWVLKMSAYRYTITHIPGEHNLWADMVSRWGQAGYENTSQVQVRRVATRSVAEPSILRPLQDSEFVWPTKEDVVRAQRQFQRDVPATAVDRDGVLCIGDKMWVPGKARELIQRLVVVGHCGTEGHRGMSVMIEHMARRFSFDGLRASVERFVAECLLCKHVKGGRLIQRDWTVERGNTERNGCLHIDYLYLGDSYGAAKYVLVLKDELTHYCELVAADSADGLTAADAVLDWHKRFGLPREWVSDNGSHFKNHLLEELARRLRVEHTFVPVYTPWINGTVERVNRDILQVLRVLLMELRLDTRNWVHLLPLIQANLNHSPVASLDGLAPIELFTGLAAGSALDTVVIPSERLPRHVPEDTAELQESLVALRASLEGMHERVNKLREQRRDANMRRSSGLTCNFSEGDYVLWSRIDKRIRGNKLLARWIGPFRVFKALPHSFIIQHLLSGDEFDVHGSRLKFYCDAELNVSVEVREHVAAQGIVLGVRGISRHRRNAASNEWELLVSWQGLQDVENSWEPFDSMLADVPALVRQYVMEKNVTDLQQFL